MNNQPPRMPGEPAAQSPQPPDACQTGRQVSKPFLVFLIIFGLTLLAAFVIPNIVKYRTGSGVACINNLRQIDATKEQRALEKKKTATDTPTWDDLVGPGKPIKIQPACPANGSYTINNVSTKPRCSIPSHTLY